VIAEARKTHPAMALYLWLVAITGARRGELCALQVSDLDLDTGILFSNDPMGAHPWNPDWATHKASDLAAAAGVKLTIKGLRHRTASQLLAARIRPAHHRGTPRSWQPWSHHATALRRRVRGGHPRFRWAVGFRAAVHSGHCRSSC